VTARTAKIGSFFIVGLLVLGLPVPGWASYRCGFDQIVRPHCCCPSAPGGDEHQVTARSACCTVTANDAPKVPAAVRSDDAAPAALPGRGQVTFLGVPPPVRARPATVHPDHRVGPPILLLTKAFLI